MFEPDDDVLYIDSIILDLCVIREIALFPHARVTSEHKVKRLYTKMR